MINTVFPAVPPIPYHPCMDEQAHCRLARLHLPVAPACNLRCIYCQRGIDRSGDHPYGPGRTSRILSPPQAVAKTGVFLEKWGGDAIVGIAGPGDPLANPETIETLELLRLQYPAVRLCLCTNGLALPDHLDLLHRIGLKQLTVTVNGIDPAIVKRIQPWLVYRGVEHLGVEAAELLIARQLEGIRGAVQRGIFVKINCVVLEGINDDHLPEITRVVRSCGAGLINIVPRLQLRQNNYQFPDRKDRIGNLQHQAAAIMPVFTKCRQCRADAEGIPGTGDVYGG